MFIVYLDDSRKSPLGPTKIDGLLVHPGKASTLLSGTGYS